ncbi:MAG: SoxR reducing system RseC family protein [Candidatus Omnitrophica bacterium]|nr:SoxR reducing system RseC family protein [Candidatus Omnitrophota bacterium]
MAEFIEEGIVLSVRDGMATVKITPQGSCPDSHEGCPAKALLKDREYTLEAINLEGASPGQRVVVEMKTPNYYLGLFLVFVMPLIMLIFGYGIGFLIGKSFFLQGETGGFIGMTICFISSFFIMGLFKRKFDTQYTILKIVTNLS